MCDKQSHHGRHIGTLARLQGVHECCIAAIAGGVYVAAMLEQDLRRPDKTYWVFKGPIFDSRQAGKKEFSSVAVKVSRCFLSCFRMPLVFGGLGGRLCDHLSELKTQVESDDGGGIASSPGISEFWRRSQAGTDSGNATIADRGDAASFSSEPSILELPAVSGS